MDYSSSTTGSLNDLPIKEFEFRGFFGRDFDLAYGSIAPYAGFGYRYFFKDERGTSTTGDLGYRNSNSLSYIPLGLNYRFLVGGYKVTANAEVDFVLVGLQRTFLQDAGFVEIRNYQSSGLGYRASLAVEIGAISVGPFFKHWHVAASDDTVIAEYEFQKPKNKTSCIGIDVTYRF